MFKKILIANRGEIAMRVIKTCREMGIAAVAVYSEADRHALHVINADEAVFIGNANPGESYLNIDRIIETVRKTGADAVHPGYGFLAENPEFAAGCESRDIIFIGPPSDVIRKLGDKTAARKIMQDGGVPIIQGYSPGSNDYDAMKREAGKTGFPVVIKAVAGGGGKGMRIVDSPETFIESAKAASSEAESAFGNGNIYFEKFITKPRHIEFQILADSHGNTLHLLERECSIQRRFQKIIEESPSTVLSDSLRSEMGKAAVAAASASGYLNAGTVEFILDRENNFYFLEVNTRLQVEHPVTEMLTGIDIVRKQIEIAAGEKLNIKQNDIKGRGHAIECRIYAEDPENDFLPSPGKIEFLQEPSGPGIRVDSGIYGGFTVPCEYDPILSKLISHAETREMNIRKMVNALKEYVIMGVKNPVSFLIDILESEPFLKGETCTDFIDTHFSSREPDKRGHHTAFLAYIADELLSDNMEKIKTEKISHGSPWKSLGNWRL